MKTTKELDAARALLIEHPYLSQNDRATFNAALDRLARYDAAVPEEVAIIADKHAKADRLSKLPGGAKIFDTPEHRELGTLLAVVARQGVQVEKQKQLIDAFKTASMLDVGGDPDGVTPELLERSISAYQAEIERLKSALSAYERPMEDAELREIEERILDRRRRIAGLLKRFCLATAASLESRVFRDAESLLSALRRERAEKEKLKELRGAALDSMDARAEIGPALTLLRQYQAAVVRWGESKDPADLAVVQRIQGELSAVRIP